MDNIKTVPNQKVVEVNKDKCNKDNIYSKTSKRAINKAYILSPNTFKIWVYIASNQDKYTFALSSKDICNICGMSKNTYRQAIKELIDSKYLIQSKEQSNKYIFYDYIDTDNLYDNIIIDCNTKQDFIF